MSDNGKRVTRVLIFLSNESDEDESGVVVREFDLLACQFVPDPEAFSIPHPSKTRINYKSRDIVYVGSDFGSGTMTDAGFPRTVREWVRGTDLKDAPVIFEGKNSDVSVASYINDQRHRGGKMYEIRSRIVGSSSTRHWVRKVKSVQERSPAGLSEFKELQVPENSETDFAGNVLLIALRSNWQVEAGKKFKKGSIVYVNAHKFLKYGPIDRIYHVLFEPKENNICDDFIVTKEFLILSVCEGAKSGLQFHRLTKDANKLRLVFTEEKTEARTINIRAVDPYSGDQFWFSTTGFIHPSTLFLADASKVESSEKRTIQARDVAGYIEKPLKSLSTRFDAANLVVREMNVKSKDGNNVSYVIIFDKELSKEKSNPTLLCADSSLRSCLSPTYSALPGMAWIERGGVYVEANILGVNGVIDIGNNLRNKDDPNRSVDDFLAVAEDLVSSKICSAKSLTIRGGSRGALVILHAYLRRPDLFAAVSCVSPVTDLKRLETLGCPLHWIAAFGDHNSDNWERVADAFSPFDNLDRSVKKYPPILFTTVENASVVHPGHSRKMVKKLWNEGFGKKWPAFYFESLSTPRISIQEQYAFVTTLAYDFLFKKATRSAQNQRV